MKVGSNLDTYKASGEIVVPQSLNLVFASGPKTAVVFLRFFYWGSCWKCYAMNCFGTYFTHAQTCDVTRVQSATERTASVHTLHMPKPVM